MFKKHQLGFGFLFLKQPHACNFKELPLLQILLTQHGYFQIWFLFERLGVFSGYPEPQISQPDIRLICYSLTVHCVTHTELNTFRLTMVNELWEHSYCNYWLELLTGTISCNQRYIRILWWYLAVLAYFLYSFSINKV